MENKVLEQYSVDAQNKYYTKEYVNKLTEFESRAKIAKMEAEALSAEAMLKDLKTKLAGITVVK